MRKRKIIFFALLLFCIATLSNNEIQLANETEGKIAIELYGIKTEETNY